MSGWLNFKKRDGDGHGDPNLSQDKGREITTPHEQGTPVVFNSFKKTLCLQIVKPVHEDVGEKKCCLSPQAKCFDYFFSFTQLSYLYVRVVIEN